VSAPKIFGGAVAAAHAKAIDEREERDHDRCNKPRIGLQMRERAEIRRKRHCRRGRTAALRNEQQCPPIHERYDRMIGIAHIGVETAVFRTAAREFREECRAEQRDVQPVHAHRQAQMDVVSEQHRGERQQRCLGTQRDDKAGEDHRIERSRQVGRADPPEAALAYAPQPADQTKALVPTVVIFAKSEYGFQYVLCNCRSAQMPRSATKRLTKRPVHRCHDARRPPRWASANVAHNIWKMG